MLFLLLWPSQLRHFSIIRLNFIMVCFRRWCWFINRHVSLGLYFPETILDVLLKISSEWRLNTFLVSLERFESIRSLSTRVNLNNKDRGSFLWHSRHLLLSKRVKSLHLCSCPEDSHLIACRSKRNVSRNTSREIKDIKDLSFAITVCENYSTLSWLDMTRTFTWDNERGRKGC